MIIINPEMQTVTGSTITSVDSNFPLSNLFNKHPRDVTKADGTNETTIRVKIGYGSDYIACLNTNASNVICTITADDDEVNLDNAAATDEGGGMVGIPCTGNGLSFADTPNYWQDSGNLVTDPTFSLTTSDTDNTYWETDESTWDSAIGYGSTPGMYIQANGDGSAAEMRIRDSGIIKKFSAVYGDRFHFVLYAKKSADFDGKFRFAVWQYNSVGSALGAVIKTYAYSALSTDYVILSGYADLNQADVAYVALGFYTSTGTTGGVYVDNVFIGTPAATPKEILINGTINYDGIYMVENASTPDKLIIEATYAAETFAGTETAAEIVDAEAFDLQLIDSYDRFFADNPRVYRQFWMGYTYQVGACTATIELTANEGDVVYAGAIKAGPGYEFPNPLAGFHEGRRSYGIKKRTNNGSLYGEVRNIVRTFSAEVWLRRATDETDQLRKFMDVYDQFGEEAPFVILLQSNIQDQEWAAYCTFDSAIDVEHALPNHSLVSFKLVEEI